MVGGEKDRTGAAMLSSREATPAPLVGRGGEQSLLLLLAEHLQRRRMGVLVEPCGWSGAAVESCGWSSGAVEPCGWRNGGRGTGMMRRLQRWVQPSS
jgi:hypothetical protein